MKHLTKINNKYETEQEWLNARLNYLNGSEIGAMMMLSPYKSRLQLYLEKIGEKQVIPFDNMKTFMGRYLEDKIVDLWKYWGGDEEQLRKNYSTDNIVRQCRRMNCSVINNKRPYLCCSVDRVISMIDGKKSKGILEVKSTNNFATSIWENGIDPSHIVQLQAYLMTFEYEYGELCVLKNGNTLDVYQFSALPELQNKIEEHAKAFWDRVLIGRNIKKELDKAKQDNDKVKVKEYSWMLSNNEPEAEGTSAYDDFITERYKSNDSTITLNSDNQKYLNYAITYAKLNKEIKELESNKLKYSALIKTYMKEYGLFDMTPYGKVTWRNNSKGVRTFYININKEHIN
jgi:putative phage-type endonuclease